MPLNLSEQGEFSIDNQLKQKVIFLHKLRLLNTGFLEIIKIMFLVADTIGKKKGKAVFWYYLLDWIVNEVDTVTRYKLMNFQLFAPIIGGSVWHLGYLVITIKVE